MSVFSKSDVDAVLATLPEELRTPNSVACSVYLNSGTNKFTSVKSHVFEGDHWGTYAGEIRDDDDNVVHNMKAGDCCGRALGRQGFDLVLKTNPEIAAYKEHARRASAIAGVRGEEYKDDGSSMIATMCLIPYDAEDISFGNLPIRAQEEIKHIVTECMPYFKLHQEDDEEDDEDDEDLWERFKLVARYPNPMAFRRIELGNVPIIIDFCLCAWFGESESDDYFLSEHQVFLPMTDELLVAIFSESQFIMRTLLGGMNPCNPPWLANALCQSVNAAFVAAMKRMEKADSVAPKKKIRAKRNDRYDVVTESPEELAKARAQAKQAYADMVAKHEERERKQAEERRQAERARREAIQKQREERASAPEKPYSVAGPSHKSKDAPAVCEPPDALARAKRELEKAAGIESAARHAAELKAAEEERIAAEEAKRELRRLGKEIGGC
jgi:hypothetical protein